MPAYWKLAKRRQKDVDASWKKKHGKRRFGVMLSINVDKKYKLIRKIETYTASKRNSQYCDKVQDPHKTSRDVHGVRG